MGLFLCHGWKDFTWIKDITLRCTYLYNHAIYFNQTSHKLSKQLWLSNYAGKINDLWPISWSCDLICLPNSFSNAKISVYLTISQKILKIFSSFIFYFLATLLFVAIKAKNFTLKPFPAFRIHWNSFWFVSSIRPKAEIICRVRPHCFRRTQNVFPVGLYLVHLSIINWMKHTEWGQQLTRPRNACRMCDGIR